MAALAPLALDEYDFASLRQAGQAYVDKTAHIQRRLAGRTDQVLLPGAPALFRPVAVGAFVQPYRRCPFPGSAASEPVYNPISYLTVLRQLTRPQYAVQVRAQGFPQPWIETGQTHFLFRCLQARGQPLTENDISEGGVRDAQRPTLNAWLFQAGYVTFARAPGQRALSFPNLEVHTAFYAGLFRHWFREPAGRGSRIFKLVRAVGRVFEARDCGAGLAAFDQMLNGMNCALLRAESHFQIAFPMLGEVAADILDEPRDLHAASERLTRCRVSHSLQVRRDSFPTSRPEEKCWIPEGEMQVSGQRCSYP